MANVHDVAAAILRKQGPMTALKLEKLVYYCQAWSLVWDEAPLFTERIEAWAGGPVVPALYYHHRGQFQIDRWEEGNPEVLNQAQNDTIDAVLKYYGNKTSQWLSDLTHSEDPWINARQGLAPLERGNRAITLASIDEYYSGL
ncbi:MAG TPA: type II toxin-antitoxin system antitoxin SocA domain-containing protein [Edaphobacter sp.]|jgi:uncharacterized phage-associated protein|nr:type II toxin-antitoxin system antitoxin SocA domain-containing protein [Edaphobacter sp.]